MFKPSGPLPPEPQRAIAFNKGKPQFSMVPPLWFKWLLAGFQCGIDKGYPKNNWAQSVGTDEEATFQEMRLDSLLRHLDKYREGHHLDDETGVPHLALLAWNALLILHYDVLGKKGLPKGKYEWL